MADLISSNGRSPYDHPKTGKRSLELEIFGHRLTVVSDNEDAHVSTLVQFVHQRLQNIQDASGRVETDQIALLAALNIAEELFRERQAHEALKASVRARGDELLGFVDRISDRLNLVEGSGAP